MGAALIAQLIASIANTIMGLLGKNGVVSNPIAELVESLVAAGAALFSAFTSGGSASSETQAALTQLDAMLTAIQQDTSTDPNVLGLIDETAGLVRAAIVGFAQADSGQVDPSTLDVPPAVS